MSDIIKVKVRRKSVVRAKASVRFPANVLTSNFLTATRDGGAYTLGVDYTVLTPGPVSDPASAYLAVRDQTSGVYRTVTLASLLTSGLDADLQVIAALSGTGMLSRTGTNTWALRTIAGTASEITVTNGDGVAAAPTISIPANAITNAKMATMAAYTIKGNATGSSAVPTDIDITALTAKASPVSADIILIQDSAASNAFKKATVGSLPGGGGGVTSLAGLTGVITAEQVGLVHFGGRLTPLSATPVPAVDVVGSQNLYYAPLAGSKVVPVYTAATGWALKTFTSSSTDQVGLTLSLAGSANWAADSLHDVFAVMDSGTLKLATRAWDAGMLPTEVLITPATTITTGTAPTAWTNPSNAFDGTTSKTSAGAIAIVSPSNSGPQNCLGQDWGAGITKIVSKVVVYAPTDTTILGSAPTVGTFTVHGSNDNTNWHLMTVWRGNDSANGTVFTIPISITEQQPYRYHRLVVDGNGANAIRVAQVQFFNKVAPASGRRLTSRDGILVNDASITARTGAATTITTAQYEGTFLGTIHIDTATAGQITSHVTYGPSRTDGVWNCYNRRRKKLLAGTYSPSNFYVPVTTQLWNSCESATQGSVFSLQVVCGLSEEWVGADLTRSVYMNTTSPASPASYECGIGVDTTLNFSGAEGSCNIDNSGATSGAAIGFLPRAWLSVPPFAGIKTLYAIERQGNNGTGTQNAFTGPRSTQLVAEWMG